MTVAGERDSLPPFAPFSRSLGFWTFSPLFPFSVGFDGGGVARASLPPSLPPCPFSCLHVECGKKKGTTLFLGREGDLDMSLCSFFWDYTGLIPNSTKWRG